MSDTFDKRVNEFNEWYSGLGRKKPLDYRIKAFCYGCYSLTDLLFPKPILDDISPLPKYQLTETQRNAIFLGANAKRQIQDLESMMRGGAIRTGFFFANLSFYNELYNRAKQEYSKR